MRYSDFSKALLLHPGVVRIERLTDDLLDKVRGMEYEHANEGVMLSEPIGLREIASKDLKLILFCSLEFRMFTEPFMEIIDERGTVVGHDVMMGAQDFECEDQIWLMHNLFININLVTEYRMRNFIHSLSLDIDGVPDDVSPRVFYPCLATANYLNGLFDAKGKIVATVLLGADNISLDGRGWRDRKVGLHL